MNNEKKLKKGPYIVMSISKDNGGIEIHEDISGNIPEINSLMTIYLIHLCQNFAKKPVTTDGKQLKAREILMSIVLATVAQIDVPLGVDVDD